VNALSSQAAASLLFSWESPQRGKLAIIGFLAASAILHAFCFYVFQVVYPPAVVLLPPPARVNLIAPNSEEGRTLLRWVDAEDPALASATMRPPEARLRALPKLQHIPSYLAREPQLKKLPPLIVDLRAPSSQPPEAVPIRPRQIAKTIVPTPTRVLFSDELTGLGPAKLPTPNFTASITESPESVRFRIGISPGGEIRYCFPLNSSGDSALNEQARQYLALSRFPQRSAVDERSDQPLVWGIATVEWGNDVTRPRPASTITPAP
jgi:hypothetical protein